VCWVFAQLPQFISNFRNKSAEALSPWFLAQWLLGDTFNLTGALMQGEQLATTTYTAMYEDMDCCWEGGGVNFVVCALSHTHTERNQPGTSANQTKPKQTKGTLCCRTCS
jgi:hypothetical protein